MKRKILIIALIFCGFGISSTFADSHMDAGKKFDGATSGYEGREDRLGRSMAVVLKSLNATEPYQHDINDALVKMILTTLQFAKNNDMIDELIASDVEVVRPLLERVRRNYLRTGKLDTVMVGMIDRTACAYQLFVEIEMKDGERSWQSPFGLILEHSVRLGQHDLTEKEVHDIWIKKRFHAYAEVIGVDLFISEWTEDGKVSIKVLGPTLVAQN